MAGFSTDHPAGHRVPALHRGGDGALVESGQPVLRGRRGAFREYHSLQSTRRFVDKGKRGPFRFCEKGRPDCRH